MKNLIITLLMAITMNSYAKVYETTGVNNLENQYTTTVTITKLHQGKKEAIRVDAIITWERGTSVALTGIGKRVKNKIVFKFEDSFNNKGIGYITRDKENPYKITLDFKTIEVEAPRAAKQLGQYILNETEKSKAELTTE